MERTDSVLMAGAALGGVFLISHGYLTTVWNYLYNAAHSGPVDPFSQSQNPFNPVVVGTGGDAVTGQIVGHGTVTIAGTLHGNTMTPSDSRIPQFQVPAVHNGPNDIPANILAILIRLGLYK